MRDGIRVWTIGHSTKTSEEFGRLILSHDMQILVDVRSFPGSRRYPHFNKTELAQCLAALRVEYKHFPQLGGRRKPGPHSHNTAWRNESFRAYADYMETEAFHQGVNELLEVAASSRVAVMCAESLWWRCHRSLIADYLKAKGVEVIHILDEKKTEPHPYTSAARIIDGELSYKGLLET